MLKKISSIIKETFFSAFALFALIVLMALLAMPAIVQAQTQTSSQNPTQKPSTQTAKTKAHYLAKAQSLIAKGKHHKAIRQLKKAIALAPEEDAPALKITLALAYKTSAFKLGKKGKHKKAFQQAEKARMLYMGPAKDEVPYVQPHQAPKFSAANSRQNVASSPNSPNSQSSQSSPNSLGLSSDIFQTLGTPSKLADAQKALIGHIKAHPVGSPYAEPLATTDTNAKQAWIEGWTGKGVKVGVIGSTVLGATYQKNVNLALLSVAPEIDLSQRAVKVAFFGSCSPDSAWREKLIEGITAYSHSLNTHYKTFSDAGHHIISETFGGIGRAQCVGVRGSQMLQNSDWEAFSAAFLASDISIQTSTNTPSLSENMLFVKPAGGYGRLACIGFAGSLTNSKAETCYVTPNALLKLRETDSSAGDRVIFVGTLASNDTMRPYSNIAGALKNDFIVAYDNFFQIGDGRSNSYATSRVAGAAALIRHKFPNLNGAQLKQVLLKTATDLGKVGVDETFGYGKLNILGALSPLGTLTPSLETSPDPTPYTETSPNPNPNPNQNPNQNPSPNPNPNPNPNPIPESSSYKLASFTASGTASHTLAANAGLNNAIAKYRTAIKRLKQTPPSATITPIASIDTGAKTNAWGEGWTGKGVKIGIFGLDLPFLWYDGRLEFIAKSVAPEADIALSTQRPIASHFSQTGHHIVLMPRLFSALKIQKLPYTINYIRPSQVTNENGELIENPQSPYDKNMLFIFSAGDIAVECQQKTSSKTIDNCNSVAYSLAQTTYYRTAQGDRVLFVGSLADDDGDRSTADRMANYSLIAGERLKNDFLVAYDDVHSAGDAGKTGFAAARVAGAAALIRQKFPSLDGAALKQVLVQTADDLGARGADPIFGQGKLNILNALSPQGKVTVLPQKTVPRYSW